jgi:hypothetical protein
MDVHALLSVFKTYTSAPAFLNTVTHVFPQLSTLLKGTLGLILLLNLRSLPFAWHSAWPFLLPGTPAYFLRAVRVWWPVLVLQARWKLLRMSLLFKSSAQKKAARIAWLESLSPVGSNPFMREYIYKTWAGACLNGAAAPHD